MAKKTPSVACGFVAIQNKIPFPRVGKFVGLERSISTRSRQVLYRTSRLRLHSKVSTNPDEVHLPVLLEEVKQAFEGRNLRYFIDGTLGMGGHAASLLEQHHGALEMYMGIDQDPEALAMAGRRLEKFNPKVKLVRGNFAEMKSIASANGLEERSIDGILLDIGTSSLQLDDAARGFSFMRDGPLDMRMDPNGLLTAADIVNNWSEEAIAEVIYQYGEERKSRSIAKKIVTARTEKPISTTLQLCKIIGGPRFSKGIHPSTLTFQALRIAVNRELHVLTHVLPQAMDLLAPGGRLAVISFHSLEDRIVKQTFRDVVGDEDKAHKNKYAQEIADPQSGSFRLVTKRPITATTEETKKNPRSRSAKLRIVEKL